MSNVLNVPCYDIDQSYKKMNRRLDLSTDLGKIIRKKLLLPIQQNTHLNYDVGQKKSNMSL